MIGRELLDDPGADPVAVRAQLGDIARLNAWFGGTRAVVGTLLPHFRAARGSTLSAVDVGAGSGDILRAAMTAARQSDVRLVGLALERSRAAAHLSRGRGLTALVGDGDALPFAPASVDIVIASQVLHHLPEPRAIAWLANLDRLARRLVVIADLRRSRLAMAGLAVAAVPLGLATRSVRDGITSLRRGYTRAEFDGMLARAGVPARTRYVPWSRIVAAWVPACAR
jgi:hypothetical protein